MFSEACPTDLRNAAGYLLFLLSDANEEVCRQLVGHDAGNSPYQQIYKDASALPMISLPSSGVPVLLQLYSIGIITNIYGCGDKLSIGLIEANANKQTIVTILSLFLSFDSGHSFQKSSSPLHSDMSSTEVASTSRESSGASEAAVQCTVSSSQLDILKVDIN